MTDTIHCVCMIYRTLLFLNLCKYLSYLRSYRTNTNIDPKTTNIVLTLIQKILALIII